MKLLYVMILAGAFGVAGYLVHGGENMRPVIIEAECLPKADWPPAVRAKPNFCTRAKVPAMPERLRMAE